MRLEIYVIMSDELDKPVSRIAYSNKAEEDYCELCGKTLLALTDSDTRSRPFQYDHSMKVTPGAKKLYESNAKAYNLMLLSCTKISYGLVEEAEGNTLLALDNKWAPREQEDLTELQKEFSTKCRMNSATSDLV
jgi:hypothetical protein